HLEHLARPNDLCIVPRACRHTNFAVRKAFEHDRDLIGLQQYIARFHGVPWSQNQTGHPRKERRLNLLLRLRHGPPPCEPELFGSFGLIVWYWRYPLGGQRPVSHSGKRLRRLRSVVQRSISFTV